MASNGGVDGRRRSRPVATVRCKGCNARVGMVWIGDQVELVEKDPCYHAGSPKDPRQGLALMLHRCPPTTPADA